MRTLIGIPLAAALLVLGATVVLAQSGAGSAVLTAAASTGPGSFLADVLSGLVDDGTITQDQADKIVDAVDKRVEDVKAERKALREQMRAFLQDGQLSADELARLPEDSPLRNLDSFLDDGKLSQDELRQLGLIGRRAFRAGVGHAPWHGGLMGNGPQDVAPAPDASAAPGS